MKPICMAYDPRTISMIIHSRGISAKRLQMGRARRADIAMYRLYVELNTKLMK
jgi:hypothetical protein